MSEDDALAQLRQILSQPEFQPGQETWWDQVAALVLGVVFEVLARIVQTTTAAASGREGWLGLATFGAALAILLALAVYLGRTIRLTMVRNASMHTTGLAERRERSDRLWQTAQHLAAAGDWSGAVRTVYLSALFALDERALLHVQSGLTNREHAVQLRTEHPELGALFADLVQHYDRLRYGEYAVTAESYGELSGLVARARTLSTHGVAT